jgi:hypothetical protein
MMIFEKASQTRGAFFMPNFKESDADGIIFEYFQSA